MLPICFFYCVCNYTVPHNSWLDISAVFLVVAIFCSKKRKERWMEFIKGYNEAVIRKKSTLMCSLSSHRFEYLQCFQTLEIKRILKSTYIVQNVMLLLSFSFLFLSFVDLINVFASFLHIPRIKIYICIYYTYIHIYV